MHQPWLDIHGHFYLPQTEEESEAMVRAFRDACFMINGPVRWNVDEVLSYNDSANIRMQMLSYIPQSLKKLEAANSYGASIVQRYPDRFGLLVALPTDDASNCLAEIHRMAPESNSGFQPDGFATTTVYNGVSLGDPRLDPVWELLNLRQAVVHVHPNAYAPPLNGRPAPLIEVAFDTARTVVDMLFNGVFRRYPDIKFVLGHCGGALPVLSGRLSLLGTQEWVPNPHGITRNEIEQQLSQLFVDTGATAKTGLAPAVKMVGIEHIIYGSDCGVPCSTNETMEENKMDVLEFEAAHGFTEGGILANGWTLFPHAAERAGVKTSESLK